MRVNIHFGGRGRRHVDRGVPRNHRHHHYYRGGRSGRGGVQSSSKSAIIIGIVFLLFTALFGFIAYNDANKTKNYIEISGRVVDYYDKWDSSSGQYLYSEIVEYIVDGKVYEITTSSSSSVPLPFGSRVNVYYNPVNPGVAVVNKKSNTVIIYVFCGIFGVAGIAVLFSGIKRSINRNSGE